MIVETAKLIKKEERIIARVGNLRIKATGWYILGQLIFGLTKGSFTCKVLHWVSSTGIKVAGVTKNSAEMGKIIVKVIEKINRVTGTVNMKVNISFFKNDSIDRL